MSTQLMSVRLLTCLGDDREFHFLQQAAAMGSVPIHITAAPTLSVARKMLATKETDVAFLDADAAPADLIAFVTSARSVQPQPFVILVAQDTSKASVFRGGVVAPDGIVVKPDNIEQAKVLVDRCIRLRLPSKVLIVDDSAALRRIIRKVLGGTRFALDVQESESGMAALKQIDNEAFDIVFLDDLMPGMSGLETLLQIKRNYPKIQVVFMTSTTDDVLGEQARLAGATAFLRKPFYSSDVDAVLHSYFGLRVPKQS